MKKFYTFEPKNFRIFSKMKSFLAVALLLLMAVGTVKAEQVTISFDEYGTSGTVNDYLSYTTAKNSSGTAPGWYNPQMRLYYASNGNGCSMTFDITNGAVVTGLEITAVSSYTPTVKYNVDGGSDVEASRSGVVYTISGIEAHNSLTFRNANTSSTQLRIMSIKVTYDVPCQELVQRTDNVSICEYGMPNFYNFNGKNLTTGGTYLDTIPAPGIACDTVVTLNLTVIPGEYEYNVTINEGESIFLAGTEITTSGDYDHYFTGSETACGCDSFVVLHVTVVPVNTTYEETATACVGSTYTFPLFDGLDTNIICTETYIYEFTKAGIAQGGRDSVRILYLDVIPSYNVTVVDSICQGTEYQFGEGVYGYHFDSDAEPGIYNDLVYTFTTAAGCDSIVTLSLTINPVYNDTVEAVFCSGELPQNVGDIVIEAGKASGVYDYSFQSVSGCDSNVVVLLTVNTTYEETISDTICASQLPYDFRGHEWTEAGNETYNETSAEGCDSIVNFTLVVNPIYNEELSDTICPNELAAYDFRGHNFTEGGTFTYNETTVNGCDSTVIFNLTVIPAFNREEKDTTICVNETPYEFYGETFSTTGTYVVPVNACGDTTATLNLTVNETNACTFTVTIEAGENGAIDGETIVNHGANYDYVITPATCYYIESVTLDGADQTITNQDGMTLTLDSVYTNHTVAATFAKYQYTVTAVGTVEAGDTYECGETAHYTFEAETGYHIDSLYIDGTMNTAVYNETWFNGSWDFNMNANHSIEVFYSKNHYTISASATGIGGTITPVGDSIYEFDAFPTYTFTFEECIGARRVLVDGEEVAAGTDSYTFDTLTHNTTIEVVLDTIIYDLTSVFHGPGLGTVNGQPEGVFGTAACASTVSGVYVDADATTHSRIDSVKWNGLVYDAVNAPQYQQHMEVLDVVMDGTNYTIDVYFNREFNHIYTHVDAGNGEVRPTDSIVYYTDPAVVTATADHGWHVATITCGDETWTNVNGNADSIVEFTVASVTSDTNVYVTFEINNYTITINTTGDGTVDQESPVTVQYGDNFSLTATPTSCTYVDSLVVDGETVTDVNLTNIESNHEVNVYFTLYEYAMTGNGANATVTEDTVTCGSDYTYTITADEFYHVDSVYVNGVLAETYTGEQGNVTHTETNVTEDKDLTAFTSLNHYTVTGTGVNGAVDPASSSVEHGGSITLQLVPNTECYELTEVLVNGVSAMDSVVSATVSSDTYVFDFAGIAGGNQDCESGNAVTISGWTLEKAYGANGKLRVGTSSANGSVTTPALDLTENGGAYTLTFDAMAWNGTTSATSLKVTVGDEEHIFNNLPNEDCQMQTYTITGTNGTANTTIKFESNGSNRRFYLDNIRVNMGAIATGYSITLNNVTEATSVEATFGLIDYTMTAIVANDEGGTVTASGDTVQCSTEQTYTLTAQEGWHVASYTLNGNTTTVDGMVASMDVPTTIAGNDTIVVDFDINTYTVTAHIAHQAGSYDHETQVVEHGDSATIVFTADDANGYHIEMITCGDDVVTLDSNAAVTYAYTVHEVVSDTDVYVYFKHNMFPITVIFDETAGDVAPVTQDWEYGENATYQITPNSCKFIDSILIDGASVNVDDETGMTYTFTNVTAEHTIEVVFADSMFTMTGITMSGDGVINSGEAVCGGDFTFHIVANEGYHIAWIMVDGENDPIYVDENTDSTDIEFTDIHGEHVVRANFEIDYYNITISAVGEGTVTPVGDSSHVIFNTPIDFTFAPEACRELVSFTIDGDEYVDSVENNAYTWYANASCEIIATFDTIVYTMAETHTGEGTVTDGEVNCGEDYTYTITAGEGYHIDAYTIGGTTTTLGGNDDTTATVDVTAAASDTTLDVVFAINTYNVTLCTVDGGTLTTTTPIVNHGDNCDVTVTADAANGYHIETITCGEDVVTLGANDSIVYTYTITNITSDTSICAEFDLNNYTITASVSDEINGEIVPAGDSIVKFGDTIRFVIRPLNDCHYISTIVADDTTIIEYNDSTPYNFSFDNVRDNHTVVANIESYRYIAATSVNDENLGTITPTDTLDCGETFNYEVTPITGYHIASVTVDGVEQTIADSSAFADSIVDIHADAVIVATFDINHYTIIATADENGTINPVDTVVYEYGMTPIYTIKPNDCYYINEVLVDGEVVELTTGDSTSGTYVFDSLDADHTIDVTFAIYQYAMTADFDATMGDVTTEAAQDCGTEYSFIITAGTGFHIVSYTIGDLSVTNTMDEPNDFTTDTVTINPVSQDTNLVVVFDTNTYTVTACTGVEGGNLVVNEPVEVNYNEGTTVTVTADAANGYHIVGITDNRGGSVDLGNNTDTTYTYNLDNVTEDIEVCATFALNTFVITATAGENGTITPEGDTTVTYGEMIDFVIEPNHTCYYISNIEVDGESIWSDYTDSISAYTYTFNVSEFDPAEVNHTISAEYTIFEYTMASNAYTEGTVSSATVECGTDYDYEIAANYGYHIDHVVLDGVTTNYAGQQTTATVTVSDIHEDHLLNVYFALNHYTVTATAGAHGSIAVAGVTTVAHGDEITYTITPDHCYYISELLVNDEAVEFTTGDSTGATYTFASVEDTMTIHANFDIYVYEMTETHEGNGTVEGGQANCGTNFTYNVIADEGWHIVSIQVGDMIHNHYGWNIDTVATFNVYNVSQDTNCHVVFAPNTYTIDLTVVGDGTVVPGDTTVEHGAEVTYDMTADEGRHILRVTVDGQIVASYTNEDNVTTDSYTFSDIDADHTILVEFNKNEYTITATAGTEGEIVMPGENTVNYNDNISFTIRATEACYHIDRILVDGNVDTTFANNETYFVYNFNNVDADHTIEAQFAVNTYTVDVTFNGNGTVTPNGIDTLECGDNATYTITPDEGNEILSVTVNGQNMGAQETYTISDIHDNYTIHVEFGQITYNLTATAFGHGTIDPMGDSTVVYGETMVYTLTPEDCYTVSEVLVNGVSYLNNEAFDGATLTLEDIQSNMTVQAYFQINTYSVETSANEGGSITETAVYNCGTDVVVTIAPNACYNIDSVVVDGVDQGEVTEVSFDALDTNHTVNAYFSIKTYVITASVNDDNAGTITATDTFDCGETPTYEIAANEGYHIVNVEVDGQDMGAIESYTFGALNDDHTIQANFEINTYTLTVNANTGVEIEPAAGDSVVEYGASVTYNFTVDSCFEIADVTLDGESLGAVTTYTFTDVDADHILMVNATVKTYTITATASEGGTITPAGETTVACNGTQSFSIAAAAGYYVDDVLVDGESVGAVNNYVFSGVTEDHTIEVNFLSYSCLPHTITATAGANGTITPAGTTTVNHGASQTYVITPDEHYTIDQVIVDGNVLPTPVASYTFSNVTENHTIAVSFVADQMGCVAPNITYTTNITENSATFNWNDTEAASYTVRYKKVGDTSYTVVTGITDVTYDVTGLDEATEYVWSVKSVCVEGEAESAWSVSRTFVTEETIDDTTGISNETLTAINVYSYGNDIYVTNESNEQIKDVQVYDMSGRMIHRGMAQNNPEVINVNAASGIYIVRVVTNNMVRNFKVSISQR